jgi:predicted RNA-binding Zn ribbon-like protein
MTAAPASLRYIGGDPSIDLVNTVDWTSRGLEQEQLNSYGDLLRWAQGAGVLSPQSARSLAAHARTTPAAAESALASARHTRWVLKQLFTGIANGRLDPRALAAFNDLLNESATRLMLAGSSRHIETGLPWHWRGLETSCEAPLWPVVWAAAKLLASAETHTIRECGGSDCGWLFIDRSRNGLRRWCQMRTCGTREKSRRRSAQASA